MTANPIDAYLHRLERELTERGVRDPRFIEETREHLADLRADGVSRGLSTEVAEHEAVARFGAPDMVAAHAAREGHMTNPVVAVFARLWQRRWWILAPTAVTAVLTAVLSHHFLPTRYRSESIIHISPSIVQADASAAAGSLARLQRISHKIVNDDPRLERIAADVGLDRSSVDGSPGGAVPDLRKHIGVHPIRPFTRDDEVTLFSVSFTSPDAAVSMKVADYLARLYVEENLRERLARVQEAKDLLDAQVADVRQRIVEQEQALAALRAQRGTGALSQADLLPYEVLEDRYRALLVQSEEVRYAGNGSLLGERYRVVEAAKVPDRPEGPSRLSVNLAGTLAGFGLGLVGLVVPGRSRTTPN